MGRVSDWEGLVGPDVWGENSKRRMDWTYKIWLDGDLMWKAKQETE